MSLSREQVYSLINGERAYQEQKWNGHKNEIDAWATYIRYYSTVLDAAATSPNTPEAKMDIVRKIAGLAVAAMEEHGAPERLRAPSGKAEQLGYIVEYHAHNYGWRPSVNDGLYKKIFSTEREAWLALNQFGDPRNGRYRVTSTLVPVLPAAQKFYRIERTPRSDYDSGNPHWDVSVIAELKETFSTERDAHQAIGEHGVSTFKYRVVGI